MARRTCVGLLTISKTSSNTEPDFVSVVVQDAATCLRVLEVKVSMQDWAQACFSLRARPVDLVVYERDRD